MHVWLVKLEETIPIDKDCRPYRMGMLADALVSNGHHVTRWCSDYEHLSQNHRFGKRSSLDINPSYRVELLYSGLKFSKGVSIARVANDMVLANQFLKSGQRAPRPDVIVCSMPTPLMAAQSANLASKHACPLVIDARDLWPDIIGAEISGIKRICAAPMLLKMKRDLRLACRKATSLVGITEFYRDHLLRYAGRTVGKTDGVFPLGYSSRKVDFGKDDEKIGDILKKDGLAFSQNEPIVYFAGRLNRTVANAFGPVVEAAQILENECCGIQFVICGSGSCQKEIKNQSNKTKSIIFPGELSQKKLEFIRRRSLVGLLPIEKRLDYQNSLSNKFFEYLSSGLPILSWLDELPGKTIINHGCGFIYRNGRELAGRIMELSGNPAQRQRMSEAGMHLFESEFEADLVYSRFAKHIEKVVRCA